MANTFSLTGNIGKDAQVVTFEKTGNSVARFGVAVSNKKGDSEITVWVNLEAWSKNPEDFANLTKGKRLTIEGRIKADSYTDKDGVVQNKLLWVAEKWSEPTGE